MNSVGRLRTALALQALILTACPSPPEKGARSRAEAEPPRPEKGARSPAEAEAPRPEKTPPPSVTRAEPPRDAFHFAASSARPEDSATAKKIESPLSPTASDGTGLQIVSL